MYLLLLFLINIFVTTCHPMCSPNKHRRSDNYSSNRKAVSQIFYKEEEVIKEKVKHADRNKERDREDSKVRDRERDRYKGKYRVRGKGNQGGCAAGLQVSDDDEKSTTELSELSSNLGPFNNSGFPGTYGERYLQPYKSHMNHILTMGGGGGRRNGYESDSQVSNLCSVLSLCAAFDIPTIHIIDACNFVGTKKLPKQRLPNS